MKSKGHEDMVLKLNKALYELKQASRAWYSCIDGYFLKNRLVKCPHDYAIYVKIKEIGDTFIVCLYVDDLIFTRNNLKIFGNLKQAMIKEFEMMNIGLMTYYLGTEIKQGEDEIFVKQEKFIKEILKKFKMKDCAKMNTLVECEVKISKNNEGEKINSTTFKSLVGILKYLTSTCPDIIFGVELVSRFIETLTTTHFKALKRILRYIKGTVYFSLFYGYSNSFKLISYNDSNWAEDMDDRKSIASFVFHMRDTTFT
jgi:hypothetical protein